MRHTLFLTTFLTLPGLAMAEDFPLATPVTEAVVFLQGATMTRTGQIDLPAGEHRLMVPFDGDVNAAFEIDVTGATLGPVEKLSDAMSDGRRFFTPVQQTAFDIWQAAQENEALAEDARIRAEAEIKAAEDQLAFLRSIDGGSLETLDTATMLEMLDTLGTRVAAAEVARANARAALRVAEQEKVDAGLLRAQARLNFEATGGQTGPLSLIMISVTMDAPGPVDLTMQNFERNAGWQPIYDVTLGADDTVTMDRKIMVRQQSGLPLIDVALTLSTADPNAQTAPREVYPNPAQLQEEKESAEADMRVLRSEDAMGRAAAPMALEMAPEPVMVAAANFDGPVVTYEYPTPVSLPTGGSVTLALDTRELEARVFNRAAPRTDETAFLMAEITNSGEEPLLPGPATLYREDVRLGQVILPLIPAGDEVELAFGPQEHLRLEFAQLDNATGDRGLFWTSGTRRQDMVFRIRNLSDTAEEVETRFALPYAEEEDLEVSVTARPAPDAPSVEDRRGVAEWILDVPAGEEIDVEVGVTLEWPEGETLIWQP